MLAESPWKHGRKVVELFFNRFFFFLVLRGKSLLCSFGCGTPGAQNWWFWNQPWVTIGSSYTGCLSIMRFMNQSHQWTSVNISMIMNHPVQLSIYIHLLDGLFQAWLIDSEEAQPFKYTQFIHGTISKWYKLWHIRWFHDSHVCIYGMYTHVNGHLVKNHWHLYSICKHTCVDSVMNHWLYSVWSLL